MNEKSFIGVVLDIPIAFSEEKSMHLGKKCRYWRFSAEYNGRQFFGECFIVKDTFDMELRCICASGRGRRVSTFHHSFLWDGVRNALLDRIGMKATNARVLSETKIRKIL